MTYLIRQEIVASVSRGFLEFATPSPHDFDCSIFSSVFSSCDRRM